MNSTVYKQYDSRWGKKPYPGYGSTMGGSGCGCVSCTHVAMEQSSKAKWTPEKLRPWMVKQGFAIVNQGTTWNGIAKTLEHIGHKNIVHIGINDSMSKAWKELDKGNRIGIILFKGGRGPNGTCWTAGGHYVAFTDYRIRNGRHEFYTKDSGGRNHTGWYSYENSMKGVVYQMWIVERIKEKKTSTKKSTYKSEYPVHTVSKKSNASSDVMKWQTFLNWWSNGKVSVDGEFGSITEKFTKQFQKTYSLTTDGVAGSLTIEKAKEVGSLELH